jgi:hypothetical protein
VGSTVLLNDLYMKLFASGRYRIQYPKGIKISDEQLAEVNIKKEDFHGEWNYTIEINKKV